jgi:hypothetical protein
MNNELESIWKKAVVAWFKASLPGMAEENHEDRMTF